MEEVLKQILNELHTLNNRVGNLEQGQDSMKLSASPVNKAGPFQADIHILK